MRIGMMADLYKPHISGVTNVITLSKQYLEKRGHEVFVFTFGSPDYQDDETNVIRSPGVPVLDTGLQFNISYSKQARNLLRSMDIVHVHHPFISGTLAIRYCRPFNIPIAFTAHTRYDLYAQAYLPAVADVIGETAIAAYLPAFCRAINLVIAPSAGMREVLIRLGVDSPIEIVPNGVDLNPFRQPIAAVDRSSLGVRENDILLIYAGRLGPEKNIGFLMRAFLGAAQAFDNVKLLLVGDGPERESLEEMAQRMDPSGGRVIFAGFVPYAQIAGYLAAADAFITASVTEVHPLSIIEAMATGLPVLGIRSPGVGDIVEHGKTGWLVQDQEIAAFTAMMVRVITHHDERRAFGQRAAQEAQKYDIVNTTDILLQKYQAALQAALGKPRTLTARFLQAFSRRRG